MKKLDKDGGLTMDDSRCFIRSYVALTPYTLKPGDLEKLQEAVRDAGELRPAVLAELKKMYPEVEANLPPFTPLPKEEVSEWLKATLEEIRSRK